MLNKEDLIKYFFDDTVHYDFELLKHFHNNGNHFEINFSYIKDKYFYKPVYPLEVALYIHAHIMSDVRSYPAWINQVLREALFYEFISVVKLKEKNKTAISNVLNVAIPYVSTWIDDLGQRYWFFYDEHGKKLNKHLNPINENLILTACKKCFTEYTKEVPYDSICTKSFNGHDCKKEYNRELKKFYKLLHSEESKLFRVANKIKYGDVINLDTSETSNSLDYEQIISEINASKDNLNKVAKYLYNRAVKLSYPPKSSVLKNRESIKIRFPRRMNSFDKKVVGVIKRGDNLFDWLNKNAKYDQKIEVSYKLNWLLEINQLPQVQLPTY